MIFMLLYGMLMYGRVWLVSCDCLCVISLKKFIGMVLHKGFCLCMHYKKGNKKKISMGGNVWKEKWGAFKGNSGK